MDSYVHAMQGDALSWHRAQRQPHSRRKDAWISTIVKHGPRPPRATLGSAKGYYNHKHWTTLVVAAVVVLPPSADDSAANAAAREGSAVVVVVAPPPSHPDSEGPPSAVGRIVLLTPPPPTLPDPEKNRPPASPPALSLATIGCRQHGGGGINVSNQ